jgi:hypothetical protein
MKKALNLLMALVLGVTIAILLAEWAVGCGETYTDARGVSHKNACLFWGIK